MSSSFIKYINEKKQKKMEGNPVKTKQNAKLTNDKISVVLCYSGQSSRKP